jgi:carnosine N-methyltransferase
LCTKGPTLWHWENNSSPQDLSIELTLDELKALVRRMGWRLEDEAEVDTTYTAFSRSMLTHWYKASFWVAVKEKEEK